MCLHVTDVHAWFVHVFCERAAAGQTPQTAPDSQVTGRRDTLCLVLCKMIATTRWIFGSAVLSLPDVTVGQVSGERAGGQHHRHRLADRGKARAEGSRCTITERRHC